MAKDKLRFETLALHGGAYRADPVSGAVAVPIYQTTSYQFQDTGHASRLFALEELGNIYTRVQNPTWDALETRIAALEGGAAALAVASGQAASAYSVLNLAQAGDNIVSSTDLYGGTWTLFAQTLKQFGIETRFVDPSDPEAFRRATDAKTRAYYAEILPNPKLNVFPIRSFTSCGRAAGPTMLLPPTSRRACSRDLTACAGCVTMDRITGWTPSTFRNRRRSARLSCIRRGPRPRGAPSRPRHAECVFMSGPSKKVIAPRVAAIRKLAAEAGRDPKAILMFAMMTVIAAPTDEEAQAKLADYRQYADPEGALTLMSGWTGVDFSRFDADQVVEHVESEAGRTALENITRADPDRRWTVREVAEHVSIGGIGPIVVGSAATVADQLEGWIDDTDFDGFNLAFVVRPETFVDVVDLLAPELQRRGRYKKAYNEGALREKLFGNPRLGAEHPAVRHRWV
jgi:hypothetical protein